MSRLPRPVRTSRWLGALLLLAVPLVAQQPTTKVKLSTVLTAFLVDSGIRTTGLPWTTGKELPVRWTTPGPVATSEAWLKQQGLTHIREGRFLGTLGDSVALGMDIRLTGTATALTQVSVLLDSMLVTDAGGNGFFVHREMIEDALKHDGVMLQPIKCKRETEGASYGNLIDAFKIPGKTASGLWWYWASPQQELVVTLTILYRRADMNQVECNSG